MKKVLLCKNNSTFFYAYKGGENMADKEVRVKIVADTSDIKKKLNDLQRELKDVASTLNKADDNGFDNLIKDGQEFKETVTEVNKAVTNLGDNIDKTDRSDFDTLTKSGNKLKELFSDLGTKLNAEGIATKFNKIKETMKELGSATLNKISDKFREIFDSGREGTSLFSRLKAIIGSITGKFSGFGGKIKAVFSSVKSSIGGFVSSMANVFTAVNTGRMSIDKHAQSLKKMKTD